MADGKQHSEQTTLPVENTRICKIASNNGSSLGVMLYLTHEQLRALLNSDPAEVDALEYSVYGGRLRLAPVERTDD